MMIYLSTIPFLIGSGLVLIGLIPLMRDVWVRARSHQSRPGPINPKGRIDFGGSQRVDQAPAFDPVRDLRIGQRVLHRLHGAGRIVGLETREIDGRSTDFYVIHFDHEHTTLYVSVSESAAIGLKLAAGRSTQAASRSSVDVTLRAFDKELEEKQAELGQDILAQWKNKLKRVAKMVSTLPGDEQNEFKPKLRDIEQKIANKNEGIREKRSASAAPQVK